MNASYAWLRAMVAIDATPSQLRELLTAHTATVDELVSLRADLAPFVVARVVEAGRHPDSDHLWLTKVDAGGGELLEVVCGAPNVTQGALYPFAPVGTTMPAGIRIERRKIRGIYSNGMLCSARELGLGEDHQGILELRTEAAPGTPLLSVMPIGDTRLVIDVGANRPDLLSHAGLARELAVITGKKWELPEIPGAHGSVQDARSADKRGTTAGIQVEVESDTATRRYMGAVVRGVKIGPSPEWLVERLEAVGVRSISNVVDATNYVLHELGQPVHAFDLARLSGKRVIVRKARDGESLVTLDGTARKLPRDAVVIADAERAQAVAGVMGGRDSEVGEGTTELFVEVASFDPKLTRSARRAIGLSTDASYRFERGVDPRLAPQALERVVQVILATAGGTLADAPVDVITALPPQREITVRAQRVRQVIGDDVPLDRARKFLEAAGFEMVSRTDKDLKVRVPSWRSDVSDEIDLVEEIARFEGYDRFPTEIRPFRPSSTHDDPLWTTSDQLRDVLVGLGFLEARPMPFVAGSDETHVRVGNPLNETEAFLRVSLLETLARRAEFNLAQRTGDVRLFEIGSVFARTGKAMPREEARVGVVMMGRRRPPHFTEPEPPAFDEWDAKAMAELIARAAWRGEGLALEPDGGGDVLWRITIGGRAIGVVQRLQLDAPVWASPAFAIELLLGEVPTAPPARRDGHVDRQVGPARAPVTRYVALPTMPPAEFDLALLVPNSTPAAEVERVIRAASGELLEQLTLFDQYAGKGVDANHRSLAWRLTFRHPERTLRDKEIEGRRGKILSALEKELNVRARS